MEKKELEALIPSETVRAYVMETGWSFTDREKAALLHHRDQPWKEECALLRALADQTDDGELREQIMAWLEWHEKALRLFQENNERQHVYILKVQEEGGSWDGEYLPRGYFFHWEEAFAFGKKEAAPFEIEKYKVGDVSAYDDGTCSHLSESDVRFDKDGEMRFISSCIIPGVLDSLEEGRGHFSDMYFEVPNPFERGDIVKTHWGFYGVVGMSSKHWKERVAQKKQMIRKGYSIGYGEADIGVDIFDEETGFLCPTDSISPLDLERYEPKWEDGTMDQLLLVAQHIYRNDGYISDYFYWLERYQDAVKNR